MKLFSPRFLALILACFPLSLFAAKFTAISPAVLAKNSVYHEVELSPDGKHIAVVLSQSGERKMIVLDASTFKMVGATSFAGSEEVGQVHWVNNGRIVIKVVKKLPWLEVPSYFGELYAVNHDGSRAKLIYGFRAGEKTTGTKLKKKKSTYGWAYVVDYLKDDEDHILIESVPMSNGLDKHSSVHKLNVYSGLMSNGLARAPIKYSTFYTDQDANLRLVMGTDDEYQKRVYKFVPQDRSWDEISMNDFGNGFTPLEFDDSGDWLYALDNYRQDKNGLFKLNMKTGERKHIYTDDAVNVTDAVFNVDDTKVYALRIDPGYPTYVVFNKVSEEAKTFKSLINTFAGHRVNITSQSEDGSKSIVMVSSDTNPAIFYLYERDSKKLSLLFNNLEKVDQNALSLSEPVSFKARDGLKVSGYYNRPVGVADDAKVPLVTLVHGGPHGIRDFWLYDREVQLLTHLGYAVLRVNFRGSGGYGQAFLEAGYKHWGDNVQYDIIDGTRWAIENLQVDPGKVCIMGASFGGYSAVQSATIAPDLFKCVVANAGVYDLEMMYKEGDIPERGFGESYLDLAVGKDEAQLRDFSPVHRVSLLKAPVFIAHGKKDRRVPIEQAEALREQLDKHNKQYQWFIRSTEAHGFYDEENRTEYFEAVATFLGEHLHQPLRQPLQ